jgi:type IV secretory pathway VirB10-like protein
VADVGILDEVKRTSRLRKKASQEAEEAEPSSAGTAGEVLQSGVRKWGSAKANTSKEEAQPLAEETKLPKSKKVATVKESTSESSALTPHASTTKPNPSPKKRGTLRHRVFNAPSRWIARLDRYNESVKAEWDDLASSNPGKETENLSDKEMLDRERWEGKYRKAKRELARNVVLLLVIVGVIALIVYAIVYMLSADMTSVPDAPPGFLPEL